MAESGPSLVARIGLFEATLVVMGGIVGSGIFVNPSVVARHVHSAPLILGAWVVGGVVALVGAFVYAELSERMPAVGGQYAYLREAFHPLVAFLCGWALLLVINAGGVAAVAVTFARYALELTGIPMTETALAVVTIGGLAAINCLGVRSGSLVQGILMVLKIGALIALVVLGWLFHRPPSPSVAAPPDGLLAFGGAMVPVLFAYGGWQTTCFIASEVRDPRLTLPRALVAGVVTVIVLYVGVSWVCLAGLGPSGLADTETPASALMRRTLGERGATFIALGIAVSTLGFLSQSLLTMPRVYFAMAADGLFFRSVARVWPRTHAPVVAIVVLASSSIAVALTGRYDQILGYVVFADWVFFGLSAASLFVLRSRNVGGDPGAIRFPVPGHPWTTGGFVLVSALVVLSTVRAYPSNTAIGLAVLLAGLPAYWFLTRRTRSRPGTLSSPEG
ncbi:MAG TPA: amino acid permease [Myxococcaceae bacterium]|nr:amino acid permease [Myxococcaceae bacterium]